MLEVVRVASMGRRHWDTLVVDKLSVGGAIGCTNGDCPQTRWKVAVISQWDWDRPPRTALILCQHSNVRGSEWFHVEEAHLGTTDQGTCWRWCWGHHSHG